jgi:hypothetical protein
MFIMMNAARLGVGLQGLGQAEASYQNALRYAGERRQGRAPSGPADPGEKADLLLVHPDVRRMLMDGKALTEGARAFCLWGALQVDLARRARSDIGYQVATSAQQVFGGHGYIRDHGMDQYVRDARGAMIYEGTNGVQAMDLVGRKLFRDQGRAMHRLFALMEEEIALGRHGHPAVGAVADHVRVGLDDQRAATAWLARHAGDPLQAAAGAHSYLAMTGILALGWMWLKMTRASADAIAAGKGVRAFHEAKLVTARYYCERIMPDIIAHRRKIESGAEALMQGLAVKSQALMREWTGTKRDAIIKVRDEMALVARGSGLAG